MNRKLVPQSARRRVLGCAAAAATVGLTAVAGAQTWNGTTTGNWNSSANWVGGTIPVSSTTTALTFNDSGTTSYTSTNDISAAFNLNSLTLNNSGTGTITLAGSSITFAGTTPSIVASGATLITAPFAGSATIGISGGGTVTQSSNSNGFTGTVNITNATFAVTNLSGTHNFNAVSIVADTGGIFNFGGGSANLPNTTYITAKTGGTVNWSLGETYGGFNMDGGTFNMNGANMTIAGTTANDYRSGSINGSTGAQIINGSAANTPINKTTSGTVTVTGVTFNNPGGLNLREGVLATNTNITNGTVTFGAADGSTAGTLRNTGSSLTMARPVVLNAGGGTWDVLQAQTTITSSGGLSGSGPLAKSGIGTLLLQGTLAQTGTTTVNQGTLRVQPGSSAGKFAAASSGTLALAAGGGTSTFTLPQLDLQGSNATLRLELDGTVPTVPLINVTGTDGLTIGGSPTLTLSAYPAGTYTLIDYTGSPITSGFNFAFPGRTTGNLIYDTANTRIDLSVAGTDTIKWTGNVNTSWDVGNAPDSGGTKNFQYVNAGTATNFINTDTVTFDDSTSNRTVDLAVSVAPASVTVNTAGTYVFQGAGQISGSGTLSKLGTGTLAVATNNSYSGGTSVAGGGTLQVGNGGTSGNLAGTVSLASDGFLSFKRSDTFTFGANLSGTGTVVVNNPSTVTLSADSPLFTGTFSLKSGKLAITAYSQLGPIAATSSTTQFDGGTLLFNANAPTPGAVQPWVVNAGGGTVEVLTGFTAAKNGGSLSGSGDLTKTGAGTFSVGTTSGGATGFTGRILVNQGIFQTPSNQLVSASGVVVASGAQYSLQDNAVASFNIGSGALVKLNGTGPTSNGAMRLSDQTGGSSLGPKTTFTNGVELTTDASIGVDNGATGRTSILTLTGSVTGSGKLTKVGTGVLSLSGSGNTYSGGTSVAAGTLLINSSIPGSVDVSSGATVGGSGTIAGTLSIAGTLAPGNSPGKLSVPTASMASGSTYNAEVGGPYGVALTGGTDYDQLALTGSGTTLTIGSPVELKVLELANRNNGQVYTIVDNTGSGTISGQFTSGGTALANGASITGNLGGIYQINYTSGGDVTLTAVNVVPEPAGLGLASLALGGLLARRRRSRGAA